MLHAQRTSPMVDSIEVVSTPEQFAASLDTPASKPSREPLQCASCEFVANYSDEWFEHQRTTGHALSGE